MVLVNSLPLLLWWGKQYVQIYNDSYIPVLGQKHPSPALVRPGYDTYVLTLLWAHGIHPYMQMAENEKRLLLRLQSSPNAN